MGFWPLTLTPEVFTGNPATVNDPYYATGTAGASFPGPNGARMPLGTPVMQLSAPGAASLSYPQQRLRYRYVRLNYTTAPPSGLLAGGPVYWKDNTFTVVTTNSAEAMYGLGNPLNFIAGVLLNANATNGNFIMIQTYGYNAAVVVTSSGTAAGDWIIGFSSTNQATNRVASGTAPTQTPLGIALSAYSNGLAPTLVWVGTDG
jgi:hypothetical protein